MARGLIGKSLNIAIDASRTTIAARTGTENYALQLIRAMLALKSPHRFTLYFRDPPPDSLFADAPNVQHKVIPFPRLWTHLRFAAALAADHPDVTFVPAHALPFVMPGQAVATVHDLGYRFFPEAHPAYERRYLDLTTRATSRRATKLLADSGATKRDLIDQYGVDASKIEVVYPGVEALTRANDNEIEAVRNRYHLPERYLLFLGTLQPRKNIRRLIEAHTASGCDLPLVLAGKRGWLLTDADLREASPRVILPGYIRDEDVAALYSGALALTFPSLYEGFGFPVLEAMRCGTPVLCSNTSSLPELAGDAALLVDPLNVQAIADGIRRLVSDADLRATLTQRGYGQAQQFTWQRAAETTLSVLESARMTPPQRLLAVELADIGDLMCATPALAALRESFPTAQIDLLTTPHAAPILNGTGLIDNVILFDKAVFDRPTSLLRPANLQAAMQLARRLHNGHYDTVLILHHLTTRFGAMKYAALARATAAPNRLGLDNGRGWFLTKCVPDRGFGAKHQVEYWLDVVGLLGAKAKSKRLRVGISEADRQWAREQLPADSDLVAIHPGSGGYSLARRWEPEKFAEVANGLHDNYGATIVLVGGPKDGADEVIRLMKHAPINLVGKTTLNQLAAVLECCTEYIGADSGMLHLASAVAPSRLKAIRALYGPSNHQAWGPWKAGFDESPDGSGGVNIYRSGVLCSPCSYVGHTVGLRNGCEARTCMKLLLPQDIPGVIKDSEGKLPTDPGIRKRTTPALRILGVPADSLTFADMLDRIGEWVHADSPRVARQICTVNPEFVMVAQKDINFYNILNRCDLCVPDGIGLLWAARQLGHSLPERVTGSDGVPLIAERAAREGWRLFLLGAAPGVAEKAAQILCERYRGLKIVGTYAGSPAAQEEDDIVARINAAKPDVLFVAYGAPKQDKWIARNLPRLNVGVAIGVGGSLDFIAGVAQRAPLWMQNAGIEWLHRLIHEPWRWRRMTRLPLFVITLMQRGSRGPVAFEGRPHRIARSRS